MMTKEEIETEINKLLAEKFFYGIKKYLVSKQKDRFVKTVEYTKSDNKQGLLNREYKKWFSSLSNFYITRKGIMALDPLVERELKIREFMSEEIVRVKADYIYNGIEFSAYYGTHYKIDMQKEIEDCIAELRDSKYEHRVSAFVQKPDTEKTPPEPLTTAMLKYSAFYLYQFEPDYVTYLANKLYEAKLITNPETNGWHIDEDFADNMISILMEKKEFGPGKVLEYQRKYNDKKVDRTLQECIRPLTLASEHAPKNLRNSQEFQQIDFQTQQEADHCWKLYEFIYYITLSTQLKNSIYDTSTIEITVGDKVLMEKADMPIAGEENWELLAGKFINRIKYNETAMKKNVIVLPVIAAETVLTPIDIYEYSYNSRRSRRYGVGRFITQILDKYNIGENKEHDEIINRLIDSQAIKIVTKMIHPQENAILLISWIKEFAPQLVDFEFFNEFNAKIELVASGELTLQSILNELSRLIEDAFIKGGIEYSDEPPSQAKKQLVLRVAKKNNIQLTDEVLNSSSKIDMFLSQFPDEAPVKIGQCPKCNAVVYQREYTKRGTEEVLHYYMCEEYDKNGHGCSFVMWENYIYKFFSDKAYELHSPEEIANALTKILSKKKGYQFNGFIARNQKPYDAKVFVESYEDKESKQEKWALNLEFVKNKR